MGYIRKTIRKIDHLERIVRFTFGNVGRTFSTVSIDNYPKYVLRTDEFAGGNYQGIKTMHAADFLLSAEF